MTLFNCGNNKTESNSSDENNGTNEEVAVDAMEFPLHSLWRLVDYPGESEVCVIDSTENYVLTFLEDGTFGMSTDCNSMGGKYIVNEDSLKFDNIAWTLMGCPNVNVEEAMKTILPMVDTYIITPDTSLILRSDARTVATFKYIAD